MGTEELIDLVFKRKRIEDSFFNHDYMMFLVVDSGTGVISLSPSFLEFFGYSKEDDVPTLTEMMHPDDFKETILMHQFILETGEMPIHFHHYRLKNKSGEYFRVQTMESVVLNEQRDILAMMFPIPDGQEGIKVYTKEYEEWILKV